MTPVEFEPTIPASKLLQTRALDRAATGIGHYVICFEENKESNTLTLSKTVFIWVTRINTHFCRKTPASNEEDEQMEVCISIYSRQISVQWRNAYSETTKILEERVPVLEPG